VNTHHSKSTIPAIVAIGFAIAVAIGATAIPATLNAQAATGAVTVTATSQPADTVRRQATRLSTVTVIADAARGHDKGAGLRAGNLELEAYLREQAAQIDSLARHLAALKAAAAEREKEIATLIAESAATRKARIELEDRLRKYSGIELDKDLPPAKR
jgi:hypothetical protein